MVRKFRKLSIHGWNFVIQVSCKRFFLRYQIFKILLNQFPTCLRSFSVSLSTNVLLKFFCYSGYAYIWETQFYSLQYWNEKSKSINYLWFIDSVTTIIIMYIYTMGAWPKWNQHVVCLYWMDHKELFDLIQRPMQHRK